MHIGLRSVGIISNTTTPALLQNTAPAYHSAEAFFSQLYANIIYPTVLIPHPLMINLIQINYLRYQVATSAVSFEEGVIRAKALAKEVGDFQPAVWVPKHLPRQDLWLLIAHIFHSSVVLFCISSFQSQSLLPERSRLVRAAKTTHLDQLYAFLPQAMDSRQVLPSMSWPLIVAGMHADGNYAIHRSWLNASLVRISTTLGVALPIAATTVLDKYWASDTEGWDECFDKPYVFAW